MDIAKYLVAVVAVFNFGGLVADAIVPAGARQHLFNPRWPPHAKFHNGQTMLMGVMGGALSLALLFGSRPLGLPLFLIAALIAANYFVAMALAPLFPGTAWSDPEFTAGQPRPLGFAPQQLIAYEQLIAYGLCALTLIAIGLAVAGG